MVDHLLTGVLYALLAVPLALPVVFVWHRQATRSVGWLSGALLTSLVTIPAYMLVGMNYEDFNRPFPLWWLGGLGGAMVESLVLVASLAVVAVRRFVS